MSFVLLCAAALLAAPAFAEELVASKGNDQVRLTSSPCANPRVLSLLTPQLHPALMEATAVVEGKPFKACWLVDGHAAHLIYEDGDQGLIPLVDFKAPQSA